MTETMHAAEAGSDYEQCIHDAMPLVDHLVRQVTSRIPGHVSREDLTSAGLAALAEAARRYDQGRGASFQTYATARIRGAVLDELRSTDWASRSLRRRARLINHTLEHLTGALERTPTDADLAEATGLTVAELAAHHADVSRSSVVSLQAVTENRGEDVLPTSAPTAEAILEHREQLAYLHDAVAALPQRLRTVIEEYFFRERRMVDIGADLGVSESRVSQMRTEALALVKAAMNHALEPEPTRRPRGPSTTRLTSYVAAVASHRTYTARLTHQPLEPQPA